MICRYPDAIIAASSITYNLTLFTYNIKDFKFIKELNLYKYKNQKQSGKDYNAISISVISPVILFLLLKALS